MLLRHFCQAQTGEALSHDSGPVNVKRRTDKLRDFPAKDHWQATCPFRIESLSNAPSSPECLDVEKAQRRQVSPNGIRRQLALLE